MSFFSNLSKSLYQNNSLTSEIAKSLGRIFEIYWEKLPLEKRKRVVLKQETNNLTLEYLPQTSFELMGYGKKDYSYRRKIEISLSEEARKLLYNLYKNGIYSRFKVYIEKGLIPAEDLLLKVGYGREVYKMLQSCLESLLTKKEIKIEKKFGFKEFIKLIPLFFLGFLAFFVSSTTTGFFSLPYPQTSPLILLVSLLIFLIFFLFFY
ncbi:MAG: hypothetical protein QXX07_00325 [Candidatus Aenigmatarchaeota archaeon]